MVTKAAAAKGREVDKRKSEPQQARQIIRLTFTKQAPLYC